MLAGVDLPRMLTGGSEMPGQAQAIMPGTLDRPPQRAAGSRLPRPGQDGRVTIWCGGDLQLRQLAAAAAADRSSAGIAVSADPATRPASSMMAASSSFTGDAGTAAPAWKGTPAAIL